MSLKDKFRKITSEISARHDYMRGDKGVLEQKYRKLKRKNPDDNFGKMIRAVGLGTIDLAWFLFCLGKFGAKDLNTVFLDNQIIDKWKEKNTNIKVADTDSEFKTFFKNLQKSHPQTAARLKLWMLYTLFMLLSVGGIKIAGNNNTKDREKTLTEEAKETKREIDEIMINPNLSDEEWKRQIDSIWPYIYAETVLSEGFIDEAYADVGNSGGYITIGSGFMIGKANPKGGKDKQLIEERKAFFKKVLGKTFVNGVKISHKENKILMRAYYEIYVWPYIKKSFKHPMDAHLFIELCIANFNRGPGIYQNGMAGENIKNAVNSGDSIINIVNKFDDLCKSGFNGLLPKYGVAAHRVLGNISDQDVLNSLANAVYKLSADSIWDTKDGILRQYENIDKDLRSISDATVYKNGKTYIQYKVRDYLSPLEVENMTLGKLFTPSLDDLQKNTEKTETMAEQLNEQGETLCDSNDYFNAIQKFNMALELNPDLYIVYSNLSLAYYKLGEYEKGINIVKNFIKSDAFQTAPATIKGYTYYNTALCYEKLGDKEHDIEKKQEFYQRAKKNAEIGEQVANTKYSGFDKRIDSKVSDLQKQKKSKKVAFADGIQKIQLKQKDRNNLNNVSNNKDYLV